MKPIMPWQGHTAVQAFHAGRGELYARPFSFVYGEILSNEALSSLAFVVRVNWCISCAPAAVFWSAPS